MSLLPLSPVITLADLTLIGTVADLGSTILEGAMQAYVKGTFGGPADPVSAGYFGTTKGKFRMVYPFNEQATVVLGQVSLTDESTGITTDYKTGDSWFVTKGTPILWDVRSDAFIKHYMSAS
jgi:uncharacterized cupin superfamily protein